MPQSNNGHYKTERNIILVMQWQDGSWHLTSPELPRMLIEHPTLAGALDQVPGKIEAEFGKYCNAS